MPEYRGTRGNIIAAIATDRKLEDGKEYICEVKEKRKKRSLDANAYYWQLLNQYADWGRESKVALHNKLLMRYGQPFTVGEATVPIKLPYGVNWTDFTDYHVRPTSEFIEDDAGEIKEQVFILIRGSHTYDSREMSILIDGLISEIIGSEAPIETMTPAELSRLKGYGYEVHSTKD